MLRGAPYNYYEKSWNDPYDLTRYYIQNHPDALDAAGEFYFEPKESTLYYIPQEASELSSSPSNPSRVRVPTHPTLLRLNGTQCWSFKNLEFRETQVTQNPHQESPQWNSYYGLPYLPSEIEIDGSREISFDSINVRLTGAGAFAVRGDLTFLTPSSSFITIRNSNFADLGTGAVRLGEGMLEESKNSFSWRVSLINNSIKRTGLFLTDAPAIWVASFKEALIRNNTIQRTTYSGITLGWTYVPTRDPIPGRPQALPGSDSAVIERNLIEDIGKDSELSDLGGIYLDFNTSRTRVMDNIVDQVEGTGFHSGYGTENEIIHNLFRDVGSAVPDQYDEMMKFENGTRVRKTEMDQLGMVMAFGRTGMSTSEQAPFRNLACPIASDSVGAYIEKQPNPSQQLYPESFDLKFDQNVFVSSRSTRAWSHPSTPSYNMHSPTCFQSQAVHWGSANAFWSAAGSVRFGSWSGNPRLITATPGLRYDPQSGLISFDNPSITNALGILPFSASGIGQIIN